jgi:hypothetical protein
MGTARRVLFAVWFSGGEITMAYENEKVQIPATEENAHVEENALQIEELESRVAPGVDPAPFPWATVWGT